jgi:hypothetical protein
MAVKVGERDEPYLDDNLPRSAPQGEEHRRERR